MKSTEAYTITPPGRLRYFKWLRYLGIIIAIVYFWLTIDYYRQEGWSFTTIFNGVIGLVWLGITYSYFKMPFPQSDITLSGNGIRLKDNTIEWSDLKRVKMTNNSLFLSLKDSAEKEINISYFEYNQLQEAKKKLRSFCEQNQIAFSSKY